MDRIVQRGAYAAAGAGLNYHGAWDGSTNTPTLADGVGTAGDFYRVSVAGTQDLGSGPIVFEVGDHVLYEATTWQQLDPPEVIDWGDIQGTLANQTDLQSALDAKADTSALAEVATSGEYSDLDGRPVERQSGTVALVLAGETLLWPATLVRGKIRLYDTSGGSDNTFYGFGVAGSTLLYQVGGSAAQHLFQGVDGSDNPLTILAMSAAGGVVASVDLHMSEQKISNIADGTNPRDAVNKQQLDGKLDTTGGTITGILNVTDLVVSQSDVNAQRDLYAARFVNAAFAFSTPTDGTAVPDPATNGVNIYGRDDGGQRLVAQWQDGTTNVIAQQGGGGTTDWGQIGGTLGDQTDLQDALDGKLDLTGGTLTGDLNLSQQKVVDIAEGTNPRDAVNKQQLDAVSGGGGNGHLTFATHAPSEQDTAVDLGPNDPQVQLIDSSNVVTAVAINLPAAPPTGKAFTIKNTDVSGSNFEIYPAGSAQIDGGLNVTFSGHNATRTVAFDGTNWWVIGDG